MEFKEFAGLYYADGAMDEKTRQLREYFYSKPVLLNTCSPRT
jgi:hypothetical protein